MERATANTSKNNTPPQLIIIGTVAYDSIKTPAGSKDRVLGGSAVHASLSSSLHCRTGIVGIVGGDFAGENIAYLEKWGIDLAGVAVNKAQKTFAWGGIYHPDGEDPETVFTHLNVLTEFDPQILPAYRDAQYVFLGNIDPDLQLNVLKQVKGGACIGADTMNFWIESKREEVFEVLKQVDYCFINESEVRLLAGKDDLAEALSAVTGQTEALLICKKGASGVVIAYEGKHINLPAYRVREVIDATGAGDSFAGGFMGFLANTAEAGSKEEMIISAAVAGNISGSFAVEGFGADWRANCTPDNYNKRCAEYTSKINF